MRKLLALLLLAATPALGQVYGLGAAGPGAVPYSPVAMGSVPGLSGTCTGLGSQVGGNTAGTFTATCTAQTVIITFTLHAPHGWHCKATDETTPADTLNQTGHAVTTCTLTGTTAAADVIAFNAVPF